jgi:hypothetical protein
MENILNLRNIAFTFLLSMLISTSVGAQWLDQNIIRDAGECAATGNCLHIYESKPDAEHQARLDENERIIVAAQQAQLAREEQQAQTAIQNQIAPHARKDTRTPKELTLQQKKDSRTMKAKIAAKELKMKTALDIQQVSKK